MSEEPREPVTPESLADMDDVDRSVAGAELDDIQITHRDVPFSDPGEVKADKRAERAVALCFLLSALGGIGFIVVFVAWPWKYKLGDNSFLSYWTYTPALGICLGVSLLGLGIGVVLWGKLLMTHEEAVEDRHDGFSDEVDRVTTAGTVRTTLGAMGMPRRTLLGRSVGLAGLGLVGALIVLPIGGLVKNPKRDLFHTAWKEGVRLVRSNGVPLRPQDMRAGSLETVYPGVAGGTKAADSSVMLIRLRPDQQVTHRHGQEDFAWNDYVAYSKICTHAGCPVSLYEQQTGRILCPCHQSQFDVTLDAKPVFGPATRSLPMLPITVDDEGFFVARADFREAIGPGFWERP